MALAGPQDVLGPVGLLPLGTANDLVHNLGLPTDLEASAAAIVSGRTRRIDLGQANEWVLANHSAVGLEPVVTRYNIRMVRWRGLLRCLVAALRAINDKPAWQMRLGWDDGSYDGPISLVSAGNGVVTGGLFRMAPAAVPDDRRLTFVFGLAPTRRKRLSLLPRTISGSFVNDPGIQQHHTTRLTLDSTTPTPIQVDGEVRAEAIRQVTYRRPAATPRPPLRGQGSGAQAPWPRGPPLRYGRLRAGRRSGDWGLDAIAIFPHGELPV